jgi:hypothetical protein
MSSLTKPYPPTPINYSHWNLLVDMMAGGQGRVQRQSYIIQKIGAQYQAIHGKLGTIAAGPSSSLKGIFESFAAPGQIIEFRGGDSGMETYTVEDTITIPKGVNLRASPGTARLKLADGVNKDMLVVNDLSGDQYDYIWLDGLHLDGNRANQTAGKGIVLKNITHSFIINCWVRDCRDYNIHAESTAGGNVFLNNWLLGSNGSNMLLEGNDDTLIGNWIAYSEAYGLRINKNRAKVFGNHLWEHPTAAIYLPSNLHTVGHNVIEKITGVGIEVNGHTNILSLNQICIEGGAAPTIGIKLNETWSKWNIVSLNNIVGCTQHGIWIGEGANDNIIAENITRACAAGITDLGTGNEVAHNKNII